MKEETICFWIGMFFGALLATGVMACIGERLIDNVKVKAVQSGGAEWVIGDTGRTELKWNKKEDNNE